jgi:hypothetical protein
MPNIKGRPLHTRSLTVIISRESDARWHARGDVIDLRKHSFVPLVDDIQPAGVIHMMSIDFDFDPESLRIEGIQIEQPFVAIESSEATGGDCCRDPAPRLLELNGGILGPAFSKRLAGHFGGPLGCSHLLTLFQLMSSTIPHATLLEKARILREGQRQADGKRFFRRSLFVDGHEGDGQTIDVALQLTDTHTRPIGAQDPSTARLESSREIKAAIGVDRKRFKIERIEARERMRTFETLGTAGWTSHDDLVAVLNHIPLIPGMARRIFGLLGDDASLQPLRDTLLQLAPGFIQIAAALMDEYFAKRRSQAAEDSPNRPTDDSATRPPVAAIGGNLNSCYMWREEGHVAKSWGRVQSTSDAK